MSDLPEQAAETLLPSQRGLQDSPDETAMLLSDGFPDTASCRP